MKTTTEYIQRLTITTDDDGTRTITRSSSADTSTEFYFSELTPEAQERAISDAIREEERDYSEYGSYGASQTGISEYDVINAARELEKHQPLEIAQDQGCSWYGKARRYGWSTADWQNVTEEQHDGTCYSMDICDAWNEYAVRIIALQEAHEEAGERADIHNEAGDNATDNGADDIARAEYARADFYEDMAERIEAAAEELTEEAARAVGDTVNGLIEAERDYYQNPEFWRDWLTDSDDRYTRDGERI